MSPDFRSGDSANWWIISAFVIGGAILLAAAYYMSSYWQGVFDNGGTALLLFALLAFSEPRLVRHLRRPTTLEEAVNRFAPMILPLSQDATRGSANIKETVLRAIGSTGLHQHRPEPTWTLFTSLDTPVRVRWRVEWDADGLRHIVTADGKQVPRSLGRRISWEEKLIAHEKHIYRILCYLLQEMEKKPCDRRRKLRKGRRQIAGFFGAAD